VSFQAFPTGRLSFFEKHVFFCSDFHYRRPSLAKGSGVRVFISTVLLVLGFHTSIYAQNSSSQPSSLIPDIHLDDLVGDVPPNVSSEPGWFARQWDKLQVNANFAPSVLNGKWRKMKYGFEYMGRALPAYKDGLQVREDHWLVKLGLGDELKNISSQLGVSMEAKMQISFYRLYGPTENRTAKTEALFTSDGKAPYVRMPYWLPQLPDKAEVVLKKLNPGDGVRLIQNMSFNFGAGATQEIDKSNTNVNGGVGFTQSGDFIIDVIRLNNNRARVIFSALRNPGSVSTGLSIPFTTPWQAFALKAPAGSIIQRSVDRLVNKAKYELNDTFYMDPIAFNGSIPIYENEVLISDYVFNLASKEARDAYDSAMNGLYIPSPKTVAALAPWVNQDKLKAIMLGYFVGTEAVFLEDRFKPVAERRIDRNFKGYTLAMPEQKSVSFGFAFFRFKNSQSAISANLSEIKPDGTQSYFKFLYQDEKLDWKAFWSLFGHDAGGDLKIIFETGSDFKPKKMTDIVYTRYWDEVNFDAKDFSNLLFEIKTIVPFWFPEINWRKFDASKEHPATHLKYRITLHSELLESLQYLTEKQIFDHTKKMILALPSEFLQSIQEMEDPRLNEERNWLRKSEKPEWRFDYDFQIIAKNTHILFSPEFSEEQRLKAFKDLGESDLFKYLGAGIILSFVSEKEFQEKGYFSFYLDGGPQEILEFQRGTEPLSNVYNTIDTMRTIFGERKFDLRLMIEQFQEKRRLAKGVQGENLKLGVAEHK
jgi:hypothetical protein